MACHVGLVQKLAGLHIEERNNMIEPPLRHVHNNTYMSVAEQQTHYIATCQGCGCPIKLVQPWFKAKLENLSTIAQPTIRELLREYQTWIKLEWNTNIIGSHATSVVTFVLPLTKCLGFELRVHGLLKPMTYSCAKAAKQVGQISASLVINVVGGDNGLCWIWSITSPITQFYVRLG